MLKIGFIGLGIMGNAMARNLVKAGFDLTVWNRTADKCRGFAELGTTVSATPRQVAEASDITFAMLADPAAAEAVCFGDDGVAAGISAGKGYVDMSTVSPETALSVAAAIRNRGGQFLEAPVSGSKKPAEEGTLVILTAGDRELYDRSLPALEKMGKKVMFLGEVGQGACMKLVVNMVMGGMMTMLCEGLALGKVSGLRASDLLDVLDAGALSNPMFRMKGPQIVQGNFSTAFPLKHMQKDLRLALGLAGQKGQPLYTAAAANECFKAALGLGHGDDDFSAVSRAIMP